MKLQFMPNFFVQLCFPKITVRFVSYRSLSEKSPFSCQTWVFRKKLCEKVEKFWVLMQSCTFSELFSAKFTVFQFVLFGMRKTFRSFRSSFFEFCQTQTKFLTFLRLYHVWCKWNIFWICIWTFIPVYQKSTRELDIWVILSNKEFFWQSRRGTLRAEKS